MKNKSELLKDIETLRDKLLKIAQGKDLTSPAVIEVSCRLNQLLNAYHALTIKPGKSDTDFVARDRATTPRQAVIISPIVKNILKSRNMTYEDLAEKVQLHKSTIVRILNGAGTKLITATMIANALGLSVSMIIVKSGEYEEEYQMADNQQAKKVCVQCQTAAKGEEAYAYGYQAGVRDIMNLLQFYIRSGAKQKRKIEDYLDSLLGEEVKTDD